MFDNFVFTQSTFDCVSEGNYNAEFVGTEEIASKYEADGKAIAWRFRIVDGANAGKVVSRVSGTKPTPKNKCGRTIIALLGKTPTAGENVNVKEQIGKRYVLQVVKNPNGEGTIIENIIRMP